MSLQIWRTSMHAVIFSECAEVWDDGMRDNLPSCARSTREQMGAVRNEDMHN